MAERKITITFLGDSKGAVKAVGEVSDSAGKLTGVLGDVAKTAAGFAIGAGLTQLPGVLSGLNSQARDLELQAGKAATVFGEELGAVKDWAKETANGLGLTEREATNLAAGLGDLLVPMGFNREAAAELSTKTIGLAGALAEWSGGAKSSAEVSDILTKAYLGETDGLKALGIAISAADVAARLAEKGQDKLTGSALAQAQALAIQELVFEKSTDAQNAFAEGGESNARKQAAASAKIRQLKEDIAVGLQPAFVAVTGLITDKVIPIVTKLAEAAIPALTSAAEKVGPVLGTIGEFIQTNVLPPLQTFVDWFMGNSDAIAAAAGGLAAILVAAFTAWAIAAGAAAVATIAAAAPVIALGLALAALGAGIVLLVKHWDDLTAKYPVLEQITTQVKTAFEAFTTWITGTFVPAVEKIAEVIERVVGDVIGWVNTNWPKIKDAFEIPLKAAQVIFEAVFAQIGVIVDAQLKVLKGIVDVFMGIFTGDWGRAWDGIKAIIDGIWDGIKGTIETTIGLIQGLGPLILAAGETLGAKLLEGLKKGLSATLGFAAEVGNQILAALKAAVNVHIIDPINRALEFHVGGSILGKDWGVNINPPDIPHLALGGMAAGLVRVGEFGPETLALPRGSRVLADGGRAAARAARGSDINFNGPFTIYANTPEKARLVAGDIASGIRSKIRRQGG